MDKVVASPTHAVADIPDGASVAIAGFGVAHRFANSLILALREKGSKNLTLVCNSLGDPGAIRGQILAENKQIKKLIAAFSVRPGTPTSSEEQITAGEMEVELVPQGILVERCRAGGAGIPAFYSPTSVGTDLVKGREIREFNGKAYVLEPAINVDYALLQGLSRGPPRQHAVPRRQPEFQSQLRQGGEVRDRRSGRDRGAGRDPAGSDRSARHLREARREDDAGLRRQGVAPSRAASLRQAAPLRRQARRDPAGHREERGERWSRKAPT